MRHRVPAVAVPGVAIACGRSTWPPRAPLAYLREKVAAWSRAGS